MKINVGTVVAVAGTVLGIAGNLLSNYASGKKQEETIAKKVAEALAAQTKES
jgi:biopolymer transport protein ExbB/TolQ